MPECIYASSVKTVQSSAALQYRINVAASFLILLLLLASLGLWSKALSVSFLHQTGQSGSTQLGQSEVLMGVTGSNLTYSSFR